MAKFALEGTKTGQSNIDFGRLIGDQTEGDKEQPERFDSLVVLRRLPQRRHDLLGEVPRLCPTPADTLPLGVVHVPEVIQGPRLAHLTDRQTDKHTDSHTHTG